MQKINTLKNLKLKKQDFKISKNSKREITRLEEYALKVILYLSVALEVNPNYRFHEPVVCLKMRYVSHNHRIGQFLEP